MRVSYIEPDRMDYQERQMKYRIDVARTWLQRFDDCDFRLFSDTKNNVYIEEQNEPSLIKIPMDVYTVCFAQWDRYYKDKKKRKTVSKDVYVETSKRLFKESLERFISYMAVDKI